MGYSLAEASYQAISHQQTNKQTNRHIELHINKFFANNRTKIGRIGCVDMLTCLRNCNFSAVESAIYVRI
jgi:hypothetical protein